MLRMVPFDYLSCNNLLKLFLSRLNVTTKNMKYKKFDRNSTIVLVDPVQEWTPWKKCAQSLIEPLGLEIIGAVLQNSGYKIKILQSQVE